MSSHPEFVLAGVRMKRHLSSEQTNNSFCMFENRSNGPSRTPIHIHAHEDETLFILEGEMSAIISGEENSVRAGESIFLPRGVAHQLANDRGEPAHYLLLCTPGAFEGFVAEGGHALVPGELIHPPSSEDVERMKAAAPRFGITLLADWPAVDDHEPSI
jgi:mannose-6-phosphate isomerase-like protein (cupin superfamily)